MSGECTLLLECFYIKSIIIKVVSSSTGFLNGFVYKLRQSLYTFSFWVGGDWQFFSGSKLKHFILDKTVQDDPLGLKDSYDNYGYFSVRKELFGEKWNHLRFSKLLNWSNSKTKTLYVKNTRQIILLHLPCDAGKFLKITQVKPGELLSSRQTSVIVAQWQHARSVSGRSQVRIPH